jgi:hypothetical protein
MGHHLEAILLKGPFDAERAKLFDLRPIPLSAEITMFPLYAEYVDYWAEKLGMPGWVAKVPLLNSKVVHHLVNQIADSPLFALIETEYAGGRGAQSAAVYQGAVEVMRPEGTMIGPVYRTKGPINKALRLLGVVRRIPKTNSTQSVSELTQTLMTCCVTTAMLTGEADHRNR